MFRTLKEALLLAVLVMVSCCGVGSADRSSGGRRHHRAADTGLMTFCRDTVVERRHLANKLYFLRETMETVMTNSDRREIGSDNTDTTFTRNKTPRSLAQWLEDSHTLLLCMGRALDLHCPHSSPRHPHPPCLHHPPLFQHHVLPENARSLRSQRPFQTTYQYVLQDLQQLRSAVSPVERAAAEDACDGWRENPAQVLTYSHASISITQSLLNTTTQYCQDLGN